MGKGEPISGQAFLFTSSPRFGERNRRLVVGDNAIAVSGAKKYS